MLQLKNNTPFKPGMALFPDKNGVDTFYAIMKATFTLDDNKIRIAEEQVPPFPADEYWDKPGESSLRYASDMHLGKLSTDVILNGQAWAPNGKMVRQTDTAVVVADRQKIIRVYGDRWFVKGFTGLTMTAPEPFESVPIVFERAFGGTHVIDEDKGKIKGEERNPIGIGFKGKQGASELERTPAPNLEDPAHPFKGVTNSNIPACYGFIAPNWMPRLQYAGTYDDAWQKKRMPYLPEDFDLRFFNAASQELTFDRYLEGGEPVELINLSPQGPIEFTLPVCRFKVEVQIKEKTEKLDMKCETVLFEPDERRFSMVWRDSIPCDKKTLNVEQVTFDIDTLEGVVTD
ncbi:MAG TPA: DUF2169 domain-containing protein [Chitinispirillaceae bacterium]|nr:DUF2169 domain-containing protein [Chitinispirillaceae bacterium]